MTKRLVLAVTVCLAALPVPCASAKNVWKGGQTVRLTVHNANASRHHATLRVSFKVPKGLRFQRSGWTTVFGHRYPDYAFASTKGLVTSYVPYISLSSPDFFQGGTLAAALHATPWYLTDARYVSGGSNRYGMHWSKISGKNFDKPVTVYEIAAPASKHTYNGATQWAGLKVQTGDLTDHQASLIVRTTRLTYKP